MDKKELNDDVIMYIQNEVNDMQNDVMMFKNVM